MLAMLDEWLTFEEHERYYKLMRYSKTQSSYVSISLIHGEVSRTGGTEAGVFPK